MGIAGPGIATPQDESDMDLLLIAQPTGTTTQCVYFLLGKAGHGE